MDRVQVLQPYTFTASWEIDGVATDPGNTLVTVTRDSDGTAILTNQPTGGSPGTTRTISLTAAQLGQMDFLTFTWNSSSGAVLTTYAEVVGDFYFSVAQARQISPLQDATTYTTQNIVDYRTMAEMALEDICGVAFTPHYSHHTARISTFGLLKVPRREVRDVRNIYTATDNGPVAMPNLTGLRIESDGLIFIPSFFTWWSTPITVTYDHGFDFAPPRVRRAALQLMRRWLVESPWDERATGFRTRDGGEMTVLLANHTDAFDIPEVVAVADAYSHPMVA